MEQWVAIEKGDEVIPASDAAGPPGAASAPPDAEDGKTELPVATCGAGAARCSIRKVFQEGAKPPSQNSPQLEAGLNHPREGKSPNNG